MNRSKKLLFLLLVLLASAVAAVTVSRVEQKKEQIKNSDEIILRLSPDKITSLSWVSGDTKLSFHREEAWLYDEDPTFPVSEERISERLELFHEFAAAFIIENVEDYGQYGLDDPACTIGLTTTQTIRNAESDADIPSAAEDANTVTHEYPVEIRVGNFSTMDSKRYISLGDGNVYLVSVDPMELFDAELRDMIDHDETVWFDTVDRVSISGDAQYTIVRREEGSNIWCEEDQYYAQMDSGEQPVDTSLFTTYLDRITNLEPKNYVNYKVTEEELADYGLNAPELTVIVDYTKEDDNGAAVSDTFFLYVSRNPEAVQEAEAKAAEEGEDAVPEDVPAYIRIGDSRIIYEITQTQYSGLMASGFDQLRHRALVTCDFTDIGGLEVTLEGQTYSLTTAPDPEDEDTLLWYYGEETVQSSGLRSALKAMEAEAFTDEKPSGQKEISLTVYLNREDDSRKTIDLYRYDGSQCLAVVDGSPVCFISRKQAVDMTEAINEIVLNTK